MTERKRTVMHLVVGTIGATAGLLLVNVCNQLLIPRLPVGMRMVLMICTYWLIAAVPLGLMLNAKDRLRDYGFVREKMGRQVLAGVLIGLGMSFVLTLIPIFLGKGDWVDNGRNYRYLWQFLYDFLYFIAGVGLVEEYVFRGFVYSKVQKLSGSAAVSIAVSSILFGLFHFLSGNVMQLIMTGFIGVILCLCREKIKNCSLLSLIIAHGVYDAFITVWSFVF